MRNLTFYILISCYFCCYADTQPDVTVAGAVQMADGIGRQSVELMNILQDKFDVHFYLSRLTFNLTDVPLSICKIIQNKDRPLGKVVIFEDSLALSCPLFQEIFSLMTSDHLRIAYSMFESSKIFPMFVTRLQSYFDAIVVPDPYLIKVYRDSGIELPIFVIPLGLDLDAFMKVPLKSKKQTPFVFGNFATCESRKNTDFLVRAFGLAFGSRDDVLLKINARRGQKRYVQKVRNEISSLGLKNVSFNIQRLEKSEYLKAFQSIDCYVSFAKGEGFSIQPREALALGIPVILSDNTAQTTICSTGFVKSVSSKIEEEAFYPYIGEGSYGNYFNVSLEDAVEALKNVYTHYKTYLLRAKQGRTWVQQYEYKNLKPLYFNLVKPKKIILGDRNEVTQDFLITNDAKLYEKYLKLYPHLKEDFSN